MERKQTIKYILLDTLSAMLAWGLLFLFRKIYLEHTDFHDTANLFGDNNLWFGLIIVPLGWLALYTIMGTYRNVLRKARLKELLDTLLATIIGVVAIFFLLLIDDQTSTYRQYYRSFLFLLAVQFSLTYFFRLLVTGKSVSPHS